MQVVRSAAHEGSHYLRADEGQKFCEILFSRRPGRLRIEVIRHENGEHLFPQVLAALVKEAQEGNHERITTEYMTEGEAPHFKEIPAFREGKTHPGTYGAQVEDLAKHLGPYLKKVRIVNEGPALPSNPAKKRKWGLEEE